MSFKVRVEPHGRVLRVPEGRRLKDVLAESGIPLEGPCGGKGICGKCRVKVLTEQAPVSEADLNTLESSELEEGYRLACQILVNSDLAISIPEASLLSKQRILERGASMRGVELDPPTFKLFLRIPEPSLEDSRSDADRVLDRLPSPTMLSFSILREIPLFLRKNQFELTAVLSNDFLIAVEKGDTTSNCYGLAIDLGTTTIVGYLVNLRAGTSVGTTSRMNPQVEFGDDIISRVTYAQKSEEHLKNLQSRAVGAINEIIEELSGDAGLVPEQIYEVSAVGNTIMNHLLLGLDPRNVALAPFPAVLRQGLLTKASELGLRVHPEAFLYTMPNIAGFVGGDTVGVILSTSVDESENLKIAIDIGTNGEVILGHKEWLVACSTAAGPAFEGARIKHGMRAGQGAIERVEIDGDVKFSVIGDTKPVGVCGTGLLDAVAGLLRLGVIEPSGRISPDSRGLPSVISTRIVEGENGYDFVLATEEESGLGTPLLLTQRDVRELQLAKGAISTGIRMLLKECSVSIDDVEEVLLAGAFGNYLRVQSAKRVGLLPGIPTEKVRFVGNAAGEGAKLVLLSRTLRDKADEISLKCSYIELAGRAEFQNEFMLSMLFPAEEEE